MKTSAILQEALERVLDPPSRSKKLLAVSSLGFKTHPAAEDVVALSTVGTLMRTLSKTHEDSSPRSLKSMTTRLFISDAYSFLTSAARSLGFSSISDLDELGNESEWRQMWENAITSAYIWEEMFDRDML